MAEFRLLMMIDQVGQARQQTLKIGTGTGGCQPGSSSYHNDLCAEVGIGYVSCQRILTEQLNMHRIAAKFVPIVLTQDQKDNLVVICQELKENVINERSHNPLERHHRR